MNPLNSIIILYALHTFESIFFLKPPQIPKRNSLYLTLSDYQINVYYTKKPKNFKVDLKETLKYPQVHSLIYPFYSFKVQLGENILWE